MGHSHQVRSLAPALLIALAILGSREVAAAEADGLTRPHADSAEAYAREFRGLLEKGLAPEKFSLNEAVAHFQAASVLRRDDPQLHYASGLVCLQRGNHSGALSSFRRAVAQPSFYLPAWQALIRTEIVQGDCEAAFGDLVTLARLPASNTTDTARPEYAAWMGRILGHLESGSEHAATVRAAAGRCHTQLEAALGESLQASYRQGRQEMRALTAERGEGKPTARDGADSARQADDLRVQRAEIDLEKQRVEEVARQATEQAQQAIEQLDRDLRELEENYAALASRAQEIPLQLNQLSLHAARLQQMLLNAEWDKARANQNGNRAASTGIDFRQVLTLQQAAHATAQARVSWNMIVAAIKFLESEQADFSRKAAEIKRQAQARIEVHHQLMERLRVKQSVLTARHDLLSQWEQRIAQRLQTAQSTPPGKPPAPGDTPSAPEVRSRSMAVESPPNPRESRTGKRAERKRGRADEVRDEMEQIKIVASNSAEAALEATEQAWKKLEELAGQFQQLSAQVSQIERTTEQLESQRARFITAGNLVSASAIRVQLKPLYAQLRVLRSGVVQVQNQAAGLVTTYQRGLNDWLMWLDAARERYEKLERAHAQLSEDADREWAKLDAPSSEPGIPPTFAECFPLDLSAEKDRLLAELQTPEQ